MGLPGTTKLQWFGGWMKRTGKEQLWIRSIARGRQTLAARHASLLLAASLMSVGAFAACSGDENAINHPGSDAGATIDSSNPGADSGRPGADSANPGADAGADAGLAAAAR